MVSKIFYFLMVSVLCIFVKSVAFAQTYSIKLKTFDACGEYESTCTMKDKVCSSTLQFPFEKKGKYSRINAEISIKDKFLDIDFNAEGQDFSTSEQGWQFFSTRVDDFSLKPKIVELYFPNPAIKDDRGAIPLVIRSGNKFITAVSIDVQLVPSDQ